MNLPMINSTNSVSTSKRKREAERSVNWTVEETQVLLCAWSDERIQKSLAENLRNRHVFKLLSTRMCELGFARTPHQCRLRVKTLKANYVRAKLQRGSSAGQQPGSFKYFAEMDAVLGRRALAGSDGGRRHVGDSKGAAAAAVLPQRTEGGLRPGVAADSAGEPRFSSPPFPDRSGGRRPLAPVSSAAGGGGEVPAWQPEAEVKMEDRGNSTDEYEYEYSDAGFSRPLRDGEHDFLGVYQDHSGPVSELNHRSASPLALPPMPPPPPPPPATTTTTTGSRARPHSPSSSSSSYSSSAEQPPQPEGPGLGEGPGVAWAEPALGHLSRCFQRLVAETRGLLVQLEAQRQEQAAGQQQLLSGWLEREERRQREAADREERRERARMAHEIRVLELLGGLARGRGPGTGPATGEERCRCGRGDGGAGPGLEAAAGGSLHHGSGEGR